MHYGGFIQLAGWLASGLYMIIAVRRVYGCALGAAVLRSIGVLAVYALSFSVCVLVAAKALVVFGVRL